MVFIFLNIPYCRSKGALNIYYSKKLCVSLTILSEIIGKKNKVCSPKKYLACASIIKKYSYYN